MKDRNVLIAASIVMGFAALLHFVRVIAGWDLVIESWLAPRWISVLALLIAGFLSYKVFVISNRV